LAKDSQTQDEDGARNSIFAPELGRFFVAVPSEGQKEAELLVFQVNLKSRFYLPDLIQPKNYYAPTNFFRSGNPP